MTWLRIFLIIFIVVLTSCAPSTDSEVKALVVAKNRWLEATEGSSYAFTLEGRCRGMHCRVSKTRIKVVGGVVVSAYDLHEAREIDNVSDTSSVKSVFLIIFDLIKSNAHVDASNWDVEYHSTLGYPMRFIYGTTELYIYDVTIE